jgi:hypothetical protein
MDKNRLLIEPLSPYDRLLEQRLQRGALPATVRHISQLPVGWRCLRLVLRVLLHSRNLVRLVLPLFFKYLGYVVAFMLVKVAFARADKAMLTIAHRMGYKGARSAIYLPRAIRLAAWLGYEGCGMQRIKVHNIRPP